MVVIVVTIAVDRGIAIGVIVCQWRLLAASDRLLAIHFVICKPKQQK